MMALDGSGVSRDPGVVAAYEADPLVNHGKVTAGLGIAIFDAMDRVMAQAATLRLPMLIMHGGADTLAAPEGSRAFADKVSAEDLTWKCCPGCTTRFSMNPRAPKSSPPMPSGLRRDCLDRPGPGLRCRRSIGSGTAGHPTQPSGLLAHGQGRLDITDPDSIASALDEPGPNGSSMPRLTPPLMRRSPTRRRRGRAIPWDQSIGPGLCRPGYPAAACVHRFCF